MNDTLDTLLAKIRELEGELLEAGKKKEKEFRMRFALRGAGEEDLGFHPLAGVNPLPCPDLG